MQLSNTGLDIYQSIDKVVILNAVHRVHQIDNPQTEEEHDYNARAERFMEVLHRVRDLTLTEQDYFWLCGQKRSRKSLTEINRFKDAPMLMDYRRQTEANAEENCTQYNLMHHRLFAREKCENGLPF